MKTFVRMTKLTDIRGRADYITNIDKQEHILVKSPSVDWQPYHDFEKQKTNSVHEGRELIISLPNDWQSLSDEKLFVRADALAQTAIEKATDYQWAVHWNHDRTNLHMHVIFSERTVEQNNGTWSRDVYLTEDGKIALRKTDRAKDRHGKDKAPIHRKGEPKGGFSVKDKRYSSRKWLQDTKERLKQTMIDRYDVIVQPNDPLAEHHEGKGKESSQIKLKNEVIRLNNQRLKELEAHGFDTRNYLNDLKEMRRRHLIGVLECVDGEKIVVKEYPNSEIALKRSKSPHNRVLWSQGINIPPKALNALYVRPEPQKTHFKSSDTSRLDGKEQKRPQKDHIDINQSVLTAPKRTRETLEEFKEVITEESRLRTEKEKYHGLKGFLEAIKAPQAELNELQASHEKSKKQVGKVFKKLEKCCKSKIPYDCSKPEEWDKIEGFVINKLNEQERLADKEKAKLRLSKEPIVHTNKTDTTQEEQVPTKRISISQRLASAKEQAKNSQDLDNQQNTRRKPKRQELE